jgi:hypothetical protein
LEVQLRDLLTSRRDDKGAVPQNPNSYLSMGESPSFGEAENDLELQTEPAR